MEVAFPLTGCGSGRSAPIPGHAGEHGSLLLRAPCREALLDAILGRMPEAANVVFPHLLDFDLESIVRRHGLTPLRVSARLFHHDLAALADAVGKDTVLLYLTNPNDVTGTRLPSDLLRSFFEQLPAHVRVLLDETAAGPAGECRQGADEATVSASLARLMRVFALTDGSVGALPASGENVLMQNSDTARHARMQEVEHMFAVANLQHVPTTTGFVCFRAPDPAGLLARLCAAGVSACGLAHVGMPEWLRADVARADGAAGFASVLQEFLKGSDV